jgi:hypothetical protein
MSEAYRFAREREEVQCRREGCKDKKVVVNIAWILLQLVAERVEKSWRLCTRQGWPMRRRHRAWTLQPWR